MTGELWIEIEKYFDPASGKELNLFDTMGNNIEDIFIAYYKRRKNHIDFYNEKASDGRTLIGSYLSIRDNRIRNAKEILPNASYFSLTNDKISVHYRDSCDIWRTSTIIDKELISALLSDLQITLYEGDLYQLRNADMVIKAKKGLLSQLDDEYITDIGKFGNKNSTVNNSFVKSLFPYFLYLRKNKIAESDKDIYTYIGEKLHLSESQINSMKPVFGDKTDPPLHKTNILDI